MRDPLLPIETVPARQLEPWTAVAAAAVILLIVLATWPHIPA